MGMKVAWNKAGTASVVLAKIKEFTIEANLYSPGKYSVKGWYNKENFFCFGSDFESLPIAQDFLNNIHKNM